MSDVRKPQPGDRVRVSYETTLEGGGGVTAAPSPWRTNLNSLEQLERHEATVEVLERADDPSKDPTGTTRRFALGAVYAKRDARDGEDPWVYLYGGSGPDAQRATVGDDVADGGEVIGVVPGTPAAEAEKRQKDATRELHEAAREFDALPGYGSLKDEPDTYPFCNSMEGATGIRCRMKQGHPRDVDHEGEHVPADASDSVGYRLSVSWPWNQFDKAVS